MEATGIEAEIERSEIAADSPAAKRVAQNHCTGRPTASNTGLRPVRLGTRQLNGEHPRQGAGKTPTTGDYSAGELTLFAPGLTVG